MSKKRYWAHWYEDDAIDEYEDFCSDVYHDEKCATLEEAKALSKKNALKHGAMVCGEVIEQEYHPDWGWTNTVSYTCDYYDDEWQEWETREIA